MKLLYYIKRFIKVPIIEKRLLLKGYILSLLIAFLVRLIPIKYYLFLFKIKSKKTISRDDVPIVLKLVQKTLNRISVLFPLNLSCLSKSIVFKLLLNSLGASSELTIGLKKKGPLQLEAHAYVKMEDNIIFLNSHKKYIEIVTF